MAKNYSFDYTLKRKGLITHRIGGLAVRKIDTCPVCGQRASMPIYRYLNDKAETIYSHAEATHLETYDNVGGLTFTVKDKTCKLSPEYVDKLPLYPNELNRVKGVMQRKIERLKRESAAKLNEAHELEIKLKAL